MDRDDFEAYVDQIKRAVVHATPGTWNPVGNWVETIEGDLPDICDCSLAPEPVAEKMAEYLALFDPIRGSALLYYIDGLHDEINELSDALYGQKAR